MLTRHQRRPVLIQLTLLRHILPIPLFHSNARTLHMDSNEFAGALALLE